MYITGFAATKLPGAYAGGGYDIVAAKFSSNGTREWVKLLGGSEIDIGWSIDTDINGSMYITGQISTGLPGSNAYSGQGTDIVVAKFVSNGTREWAQLLGSSGSENDIGYGVATDIITGSVYITGAASAALPGLGASAGSDDMVVARFSSSGTREWVQLLGSTGSDGSYGIATDRTSSVYITGTVSAAAITFQAEPLTWSLPESNCLESQI